MDFKRCSKDYQDPLIVVEENKRKFTIHNQKKKRIKKVQVDGCLIDKGRRCDYLFEIGQVCHCVIYLELKGADIEKAFSQLISTMKHLESRHQKLIKVCHIVASRVPRAIPKVYELKSKMVKKYKVQLFVHTHKANVNIEHELYHNKSA